MKQNFTSNDLIRYIYKETSLAETLAIREALEQDVLLADEYQELCQGFQLLPQAKFDASPSTLQNILRYSQHTALETHH